MRKLIYPLTILLLISLLLPLPGDIEKDTAPLPLPGDIYEKGTAPLLTVSIEVPELVVSPESAVSSEPDSDSQAIELRNPTFREVRDFILGDTTSRNSFVLYAYECRHFTTTVNNNAEAEGLRCAFVLLCFEQGQHSVIAFETTDRGLVYIEPQTDAAIHPEVGGYYQGREITEILIAW